MNDAAARVVVMRHLRPGEELIWFGRPAPGWRLAASDLFLIPFGVFWAAFVIVWEATAIAAVIGNRDPIAWLFPIFGIPFVIVGWFLTVGRFRVRAAQHERLVYALTDRRVVAIQTGKVDEIRSVYLDTLPGVATRIGRDGVGTFRFEPLAPMWAPYAGSGLEWIVGGVSAMPLQFFDVQEASKVEALIEQQREAARP